MIPFTKIPDIKIELSGTEYQGDKVTEQFEKELQEYTGRLAVVVQSGTDALTIALRSLKLDQGAKVLVPAYSFVATGSAVLAAGLTPVFKDVNKYGVMDLTDIPDIECVIGVTLFGQYIKEHLPDVHYICDNAQGFDKESCMFGNMNILSFDPMKILPAPGSGGAILCDDPVQQFFLKGLRKNDPGTEVYSVNSQMSSVTVKTLEHRFENHAANLREHKRVAMRYNRELASISMPYHTVLFSCNHKYPIFHKNRDQLKVYLEQKGIQTKVHYNYILPDLPMFNQPRVNLMYQNARELSKTELSLPIYPGMTDHDQEYIIQCVKEFNVK